jgi:hypothetical protein
MFNYPSNMTGKKTKVAGEARRLFANNLRRLMEVHYSESANKPKALALAAGVTLSTIQRSLSAENAQTLDTVEAISKAFGLRPHELLLEKLAIGKPSATSRPTKKAA